MKQNGFFKATLIAGVMASFALVAGTAQAIQVSATWTGERVGGTGRGYVPPNTVAVQTNGGGGLFRFTQNADAEPDGEPDLLPLGPSFVGFCIEFNENISAAAGARTYSLVELRKAPVDAAGAIPAQGNGDRMGPDKANLIATIIGTVYGLNGPPDFATAVANTALTVQFAIWEIVHESLFDTGLANFGLDVFAGNAAFTRENSSSVNTEIRTAAQNLIVAAVNAVKGVAGAGPAYTTDQVGLLALSSLNDTDNKQDFLVWVDTPNTEVPLPAAAWLLLSGLAGLGIVSRRKARTAA